MPTGYTSVIEEGDGCTFEEFAWRCARAFGALIEMRDIGLDAPVPQQFKVDPWHRKSLEDDQKRLAELQVMTEVEADRRAAAEYTQRSEEHRKEEKRRTATVARYDAMIAKVKAWKPPTKEHEGMKTFMLQQIDTSVEYMRKPFWDGPKKQTGKEWLREQRVHAAQSVQRSAESLAEATERVNDRNRWVEALRESVPPPKRMRP